MFAYYKVTLNMDSVTGQAANNSSKTDVGVLSYGDSQVTKFWHLNSPIGYQVDQAAALGSCA